MKLLLLILCATSLVAAEGRSREAHKNEIKELTRDEFMQRATERFSHIDKNSDGVLSVEERQEARRNFGERVRERVQQRNERRQNRE